MSSVRRRSMIGLVGALVIVAGVATSAHAVSWGVAGPSGSCGATGTSITRGSHVFSSNCTTVQAEVTAMDGSGRPSTVFGPRRATSSDVVHSQNMVTQRAGTAWIGTTSARQT